VRGETDRKNVIIIFDDSPHDLYPKIQRADLNEYLHKLFQNKSLIDIKNAFVNAIHDPEEHFGSSDIVNYLDKIIGQIQLNNVYMTNIALLKSFNDLSDKMSILIDVLTLNKN
jgi:hypothetical protein